MLKYAGVNLLLDDPEGVLAQFVDRYLSLDDLRLFGVTPPSIHAGGYDQLGIPNYSERAEYRFNTLYWPTGATRWAFGLFLATASQTDQIVSSLKSSDFDAPPELIMNTGEGQSRFGKDWSDLPTVNGYSVSTFAEQRGDELGTPMFLLDPRPIADNPDGLWVLPLVDHRYYWQYKSLPHSLFSEPSVDRTWEKLFEQVAEALGIHLLSDLPIPSQYGAGPTALFSSSGPSSLGERAAQDNAGALLDVMAHSVGRRIVYGWSTESSVVPRHRIYHLVSWGSSQATAFNRSGFSRVGGDDTKVAGGQFATAISGTTSREQYLKSITPENLRIVFPKYFDDMPVADHFQQYLKETNQSTIFFQEEQKNHVVTKNAADYVSHGSAAGTVKVIRSTAPAEFIWRESSGGALVQQDASNQDYLDELADQIARDYYDSLTVRDDQSFVGIHPLAETGHDDAVQYFHGWRRNDGSYAALTRVQTVPYNFAVEDMHHGNPPVFDGCFARMTTNGGVSLDAIDEWGAVGQGVIDTPNSSQGLPVTIRFGASFVGRVFGPGRESDESQSSSNAGDWVMVRRCHVPDRRDGETEWQAVGGGRQHIIGELQGELSEENPSAEVKVILPGDSRDIRETVAWQTTLPELIEAESIIEAHWMHNSVFRWVVTGVLDGPGSVGFWAEITGRDGNEYSWQEVESDGNGNFSAVADGHTGTAGGLNPAFEVNQSPSGTGVGSLYSDFHTSRHIIVWMRRGEKRESESESESSDHEWLFDRILPGFFAKITGAEIDSGNRLKKQYSWVEVVPQGDGTFTTFAGARTGFANGANPAFEINQSGANFHVPMNLIVRMWEGKDREASADGTVGGSPGQSPGKEYLFDRGLTDEDETLRHVVNGDDDDLSASDWNVNAQPSGKAGLRIPDLLCVNGDRISLSQDSHGQSTVVSRSSPPDDSGCSDTPFSGEKERVTDVELEINSASLSGDCQTVTIDFTLTVTKETECYSSGLLMS